MIPQPWWDGIRVADIEGSILFREQSEVKLLMLWPKHRKTQLMCCNIYKHSMVKDLSDLQTVMLATRTPWLSGDPGRIHKTCIWYICWERNFYSSVAFFYNATGHLFWIIFVLNYLYKDACMNSEQSWRTRIVFLLTFLCISCLLFNKRTSWFCMERNMVPQKCFIHFILFFLPMENKTT